MLILNQINLKLIYKPGHSTFLVAQSDVRPTGDQEVAGSIPAMSGNILSCRVIMKYFLRSFSPFRKFKNGQLSVSGE